MTLKRNIKSLIIVVMLSLFLISCQEEVKEIPEDEMIELTIEALAVFDGSNGKKAYIAVDGFIYDVTDSSDWKNGLHNGYRAGRDLSTAILSSPHGKSFLSRVPKIGRLISTPVKDMLTVISSVSGYESLVSLIYSGQVDIDFDSFEEITIFLPSLDAIALEGFFDIPADFDPSSGFDDLVDSIDIFDLLRYHMVERTLLLDALKLGASSILTLSGEYIDVRVVDDVVFINDIAIKTSDLIASNGVVHVLDGVLIPPSLDLSVVVTFEGLDGKIIETKTFSIGDPLLLPVPPLEGGYLFISWDSQSLIVSERMTIKAIYEKVYMSLSELSQHDGQNGNLAYILVSGIIYDVTNNPEWLGGRHNGHQAGQDLTVALGSSPHGIAFVLIQPVVAFHRETEG